MFKTIMAPVDLGHVERLQKALNVTADLAKKYGTPVCYVGVTTPEPTSVAHNPEEFRGKLEQFGRDQAKANGIEASTLMVVSHDPAIDLDDKLLDAVEQAGADLVVMASHTPGLPEHIFASNAGAVASHSRASVFVVR